MKATDAIDEFRDIPGFIGYRINNYGRIQSSFRFGTNVRTDVWRDIKPYLAPSGYLQVTLYRHGKRCLRHIHSLVLQAFVGPRPSSHQACHGNGIRDDNRLENLRWDTVRNNHLDKHVHGTMPMGDNHHGAKLMDRDVVAIRELLSAGVSVRKIMEKYKVTDTWVYQIKNLRVRSQI